MLNIEFHSASVVGGRNENQDSLVIQRFDTPIAGPGVTLGVFDGLGGEANGRLASEAAAAHFANCLGGFMQARRTVNDAVINSGGMTTASVMTILLTGEPEIAFYHIGDSAIFFMPTSGNPIRLTAEMNMFGACRAAGIEHPNKFYKNVLHDACLGHKRPQPQVLFEIVKDPRGVWLLATDGFLHAFEDEHGNLLRENVQEMFNSALRFTRLTTDTERLNFLQQLSLSTDEKDNATLVVAIVS